MNTFCEIRPYPPGVALPLSWQVVRQTSFYDKYSGSMKVTTHLDHINHCKTTPVRHCKTTRPKVWRVGGGAHCSANTRKSRTERAFSRSSSCAPPLPPPPASRDDAPIFQGSGFRVQGAGFRVQGSGFRVRLPPPPVASRAEAPVLIK